jgi:hypothetical protein
MKGDIIMQCVRPWTIEARSDENALAVSNGIGIWFYSSVADALAALLFCSQRWPDGGKKAYLETHRRKRI